MRDCVEGEFNIEGWIIGPVLVPVGSTMGCGGGAYYLH